MVHSETLSNCLPMCHFPDVLGEGSFTKFGDLKKTDLKTMVNIEASEAQKS